MTEEQRKLFFADYTYEYDKIQKMEVTSVDEAKKKGEALKAYNEGHAQVMTAMASDTTAQAKMLDAQAHYMEAQTANWVAQQDVQLRSRELDIREREVKDNKRGHLLEILSGVALGLLSYRLVDRTYHLEDSGDWYNRNKESSRMATDVAKGNLFRKIF